MMCTRSNIEYDFFAVESWCDDGDIRQMGSTKLRMVRDNDIAGLELASPYPCLGRNTGGHTS